VYNEIVRSKRTCNLIIFLEDRTMCSYKINNSYTVYINWSYYKEVRKITESCKSCAVKKAAGQKVVKKKEVNVPLHLGTQVSSKAFGIGTVNSKHRTGIFSVQFADRIVKFMYPVPFQQGHLVKI